MPKSTRNKSVRFNPINQIPDKDKSKKDWNAISRESLRLKCGEYHLEENGNKPDLVARLVAHFTDHEEDPTIDNEVPVSRDTETDDELENRIRDDEFERMMNGSTEFTMDGTPNNTPTPTNNNTGTTLIQQMKDVFENMQTELDAKLQSIDNRHRESSAETKALRSEIHAMKRQQQSGSSTSGGTTTTSLPDNSRTTHTQSATITTPSVNSGNVLFSNDPLPISTKNPFRLPPLKKDSLKEIEDELYCDFDKMMPKKLNEKSRENIDGYNISMTINTEGGVNLKKKPTRKIQTFLQWMEVWNLFLHARLHYHPDQAHELISYQKIITRLATKFHFPAVYDYDIDFRTLVATEKSLDFDDRTAHWTRVNDDLKHENLDLYQDSRFQDFKFLFINRS